MHMVEFEYTGLPDYDSVPGDDVAPRDLSARVEALRALLRQVQGHRVTLEERQAAAALATHVLLLLGEQLDDSSSVF